MLFGTWWSSVSKGQSWHPVLGAYEIVDHDNQGEKVEYLADVVKRVVLSLGKGGSSSAAGWEGLQCDNFLYNKIMFDKHIFDQTQVQSWPCLVNKPPTHFLFRILLRLSDLSKLCYGFF